MSEWIDVPVAEVAVGDEARINGYGRREVTGELVDVGGVQWRAVLYVDGSEVGTSAVDYDARFRRSSIVGVRRRKPEPRALKDCCGETLRFIKARRSLQSIRPTRPSPPSAITTQLCGRIGG